MARVGGASPTVVKAGAPVMNTITFLPGSASHRLHRCLQGLKRTSKGSRAILHSCQSVYNLWSSPSDGEARAPLVPTTILNDLAKVRSGSSATLRHNGRRGGGLHGPSPPEHPGPPERRRVAASGPVGDSEGAVIVSKAASQYYNLDLLSWIQSASRAKNIRNISGPFFFKVWVGL